MTRQIPNCFVIYACGPFFCEANVKRFSDDGDIGELNGVDHACIVIF